MEVFFRCRAKNVSCLQFCVPKYMLQSLNLPFHSDWGGRHSLYGSMGVLCWLELQKRVFSAELPEELLTTLTEEVFVAQYLQRRMEKKNWCCLRPAYRCRNRSANLEAIGLSPNKSWQIKDNKGVCVWSNGPGVHWGRKHDWQWVGELLNSEDSGQISKMLLVL